MLVLGAAVFSTPRLPAAAQGTLTAVISPPDASAFPTLSTLLDVRDATGQFVTGLTTQDVTALEDGQSIPLDSLQETNPGVQLVVAVDPSPALGLRDAKGLSRYDKVKQAITVWAKSLPAGSADDLSLVASGGSLLVHRKVDEWLRNFTGYTPDSHKGVASLQALNLALDTLAAEPSQPGTQKAILFISPHLTPDTFDGVDSVIQRASAGRVRIFVWLVDSGAFFTGAGAQALQRLATETGGQFFMYSGIETLPDLETYLSNLRHVYAASYTSHIFQSGQHTLALQVKTGGEQAVSAPQTFEVTVEPPSAVLLSPPLQIVRRTDPKDQYNLKTLTPTSQALEALVEFPDKHPRRIVRTTLYVDGKPVAANTAEPFDKFTWDLSSYQTSGTHQVAVEIEDTLGLKQLSLPVPVDVQVVQPASGFPGFLDRNRPAVTISAVVLAGIVLLLAVIIGGRLRLPSSRRRKVRKAETDPVTQPVLVQTEKPRQTRPSPLSWLRARPVIAPAYLAKITPDGQPIPGAPIALTAREATFGTDPVQATNVLDDPSIAPLHCRIRQDERGNFTIYDQNSVSGTWVNFEPVGREGRRLAHSDIVNIGMLSFRFVLRRAPSVPRPRVVPSDTDKL
jgi:FHA domain